MHHRGNQSGPSVDTGYTYKEASLIETAQAEQPPEPNKGRERQPARMERYTYDAHGNMTSMPHLRRWASRPVHALGLPGSMRQRPDGGGTAYYVYDAAGQRVRKVTGSKSANLKEERIYLGGFEITGNGNGTMNHAGAGDAAYHG